ncbi:hypothetical protein ACLB2K_041188 [Fragaria x ananassa]
MCKTMFFGKRKDQATKASALMDSIKQSVDSTGSSSQPTPMPTGIVPPGAPPLIVRLLPVDSSSLESPSSTLTPEYARCIVGSARLKNKRDLCSRKKTEDIVAATGQKIKLEYCPRVKGPSVRGVNSLVAHDIGSAIRSLVGMRQGRSMTLIKRKSGRCGMQCRWSLIAGRIPGRTDNEIKNYCISTLSKKLAEEKRKKPEVLRHEIAKESLPSPMRTTMVIHIRPNAMKFLEEEED